MVQEYNEISLQQMLDFRERKVILIQQYKKVYTNCTLVSLGLNVPGPHKTNPKIIHSFLKAKDKLVEMFKENQYRILACTIIQEEAGNLAIFAIGDENSLLIKKHTISLEEESPAGRLYDIDVYCRDGSQVSRSQLHTSPRKCFLCGNDAKECGRSRRHSIEALEQKMYELMDA